MVKVRGSLDMLDNADGKRESSLEIDLRITSAGCYANALDCRFTAEHAEHRYKGYDREGNLLFDDCILIDIAEDFGGFRFTFKDSEYNSPDEAYLMCIGILCSEFGFSHQFAKAIMPKDSYTKHGEEFKNGIAEDLRSTIPLIDNEEFAEFRTKHRTAIEQALIDTIRRAIEMA